MPSQLKRPEYYINRELSWLEFNRRVLEEAQDERNPLLERVKFLGIVASILDEFFEVRVAGLIHIRDTRKKPTGSDGMTPAEQLEAISTLAHELVSEHYRCWNEQLLPALADQGIHLCDAAGLQDEHLAFVERYWEEELEPILTPIVLDPTHPFPRVLNKALCIAVQLESDGDGAVGVVTVPRVLPRILRLPDSGDGQVHLVTLAGIVAGHLGALYEGYGVTGSASFRVTRNSELFVNEDEADNLLEEIAESLENRRKGDPVRLEIEAGAPEPLVRFLMRQFGLSDADVYHANGPVNLNRIMTIYGAVERPEHKFAPFSPVDVGLPREPEAFFGRLRRADALLHHPYDSFATVVDFIRMAVRDPRVLAIKQTLYRTGEDSQIVESLIEASDSGKEVTVLVELKARFDEPSNIEWAKQLEESGVHVVYGLLGMKTHCKLSMIVRRDQDRLRRYAHLGTGNYHEGTSRLYTDYGLLTAREDMTAEVAEVFNLLTARSQERFRKLLVAPSTLMKGMLERIEREAEHVGAGQRGHIIAKMNGLVDPKIIRALYRASAAGVQIDLIVRGVCCLRPGLPGISDNIRVFSIIGRYLEHSRVFYFHNAGQDEVWAGSADWMNRNLRNRIEVVFPVEDPQLRDRLYGELWLCTRDKVKGRQLLPDGRYARLEPEAGDLPMSFQDAMMALAEGDDIGIAMPTPGSEA